MTRARSLQRVSEILRRYLPQVAAVAGLWIYFSTTSSTFGGAAAIYPVLQGFALLGLAALAIGVTMIAGELDISVGAVAAVAGIVAVNCSGLGLVPAILLAVATGLVIGVAQGAIIAWTGINSLVFTIGTMILLQGIAYLVTSSKSVSVSAFGVTDALLARWGAFSVSGVLAIGTFVAVGLFLHFTRLGREIYATGGGRTEAIATGVSTRRSVVLVFALSGVLGALAGALSSLAGGSAAPGGFPALAFTAASAALVGGVALSGGRGTAVNIALGVALFSLINAGLVNQSASGFVADLLTGCLLVIVIGLEYVTRIVQAARSRAIMQRALIGASPGPGLTSIAQQGGRDGPSRER